MEAEERPTKIRKLSQDGLHASHRSTLQETSVEVSNHEADARQNGDRKQSGDALALDNQDRPSAQILEKMATSAPIGQASGEVPMSKNQQKKLQRKLEWEAKRPERKAIRKEKLIAKRERKRAAREAAGPEAISQANPTYRKAVQLPVTLLIDCDFDDLMRDGERISLAAQITRCYSDNKNSQYRAHMTVCSFGGKLKARFENELHAHHKLWRGTRFLERDFVEVAEEAKKWMSDPDGGVMQGAFSKYDGADDEELKQAGEIVYLTAEADEVLHELRPYSTYIIGGLVDKNREKGICFKRAIEKGVRTARLPIGDYLNMQSRKVLTTNHVNEIMLKWLELSDWGEAFIKVIPKRKGGKLKDTNGDEEHAADEEGDDDHVADPDGDGELARDERAAQTSNANVDHDLGLETAETVS